MAGFSNYLWRLSTGDNQVSFEKILNDRSQEKDRSTVLINLTKRANHIDYILLSLPLRDLPKEVWLRNGAICSGVLIGSAESLTLSDTSACSANMSSVSGLGS